MSAQKPRKVNPGLFDVRSIIGLLLGLYGLVLLLTGIFGTSAAAKAKAVGVNANLWVGIALLIVGGFFLVWAITRPIVVDHQQLEEDQAKGAADAERQRELREGATDDLG